MMLIKSYYINLLWKSKVLYDADCFCALASYQELPLSLSSPVPQTPPHYLIDHWPQQHGHNWSLMSDWGQWWYEEQQIDTITNHLSSGIYWLGLCRGNQGQINYSLQSISLCSEGSIHVRFLCNYKWIIQLMDAGLNLLMEADEHELHFWALYIQTEWFFFIAYFR